MKAHSPTIMRLAVVAAIAMRLGPAASNGAVWEPIGPEGGPVNALAIDPVTPTTVYLSSDDGLYKSVDGGSVWTRSSAFPLNAFVSGLRVHPLIPSTVFASGSNHFYVSHDAGTSWTQSNTTLFPAYTIALDPADPDTIFLGGGGGVARSTDEGATWSTASVSAFPGVSGIFNLLVDPISSLNIYATVQFFGPGPGGVYKSSDGGLTWGPTSLATNVITGLAIDPVTPSTLWAAQAGTPRLLKSSDSGASWTPSAVGLTTGVDRRALAFAPSSPATLYAGGSAGVYKTTNGAATWSLTGPGLDTETRIWGITVDPTDAGRVLAATNRGVARTTDGGGSWTHETTGLRADYIQSLAAHPVNPARLVAGTAFRGVVRSTDGGATWTRSTAGIPGEGGIAKVVFDASATDTMLAIPAESFPAHVLRSTDGGATWSDSSVGIDPIDSVTALAQAASNPSIWYAGADFTLQGIYRSTDGGVSWSVPAFLPETVRAVAVDPTNPDVAYAAARHLVYRTTNGGATWQAFQVFPPDGVAEVQGLAIDPTNPARLFGVSDHFNKGGVYRSINGGITWTRVQTGFASTVVLDPGNPANVLVGTFDVGILGSGDGGTTWGSLTADLYQRSVTAIAVTPGAIYGGTAGSSIFRRSTCATAADCDDTNLCTDDACAPGSSTADTLGCVHAPHACPAGADSCQLAGCNPVGGCFLTLNPDGVPCTDDGTTCTSDVCLAGACTHPPNVETGCSSPVAPAAAVLAMHRSSGSAKVEVKLNRLSLTTASAFGSPLVDGASDYAVCVFDRGGPAGAARLVLEGDAPAGGTCRGRACWVSRPNGVFTYRDADRTPDGLDRVKLLAGAAGDAAIKVSGRGPHLAFLTGPLTPVVTVQVKRDDGPGLCWAATFGTNVSVNDAGGFRARSD